MEALFILILPSIHDTLFIGNIIFYECIIFYGTLSLLRSTISPKPRVLADSIKEISVSWQAPSYSLAKATSPRRYQSGRCWKVMVGGRRVYSLDSWLFRVLGGF